MAASRVGRRGAVGDPGARVPPPERQGNDGGSPFKRQMPSGLGYIGAGLLAVWILQSVIEPSLSQGRRDRLQRVQNQTRGWPTCRCHRRAHH